MIGVGLGTGAMASADSIDDFRDSLVREVSVSSSARGVSLRINRPDGTFTVLGAHGTISALPTTYSGSYSGSFQIERHGSDGSFVETLLRSEDTRIIEWRPSEAGSFEWASGNVAATAWSLEVYPRGPNTGASNVSVRVQVEPQAPAIVGFVIPETPRWVLVRAVGPGLAQFEVPNAAPRADAQVFQGDQQLEPLMDSRREVDYAEGFAALAEIVGAFPLPSGSEDTKMLVELQPGAYTVHARAPVSPGEILVEVYVLPYGE